MVARVRRRSRDVQEGPFALQKAETPCRGMVGREGRLSSSWAQGEGVACEAELGHLPAVLCTHGPGRLEDARHERDGAGRARRLGFLLVEGAPVVPPCVADGDGAVA